MVGMGPHGGGGSSGGRFVRIRDNMDDILEARRLFRKHVAEDNNSIYRAVSDALWGTQVRTCHTAVRRSARSKMAGSSRIKKKKSLDHIYIILEDVPRPTPGNSKVFDSFRGWVHSMYA